VDGLDDFTISVWINTSESKSQQEIFHALGDSTGDDELEIYLHYDDEVYIKVRDDGETLDSSITLTDGNWHHVVLTRVDKDVCLFVDGTKQDCEDDVEAGILSVTNSQAIVIGQEQDSFGGNFSSWQSFRGRIDEFKLYSEKLSNSNINEIYVNESLGKNYDGSARASVNCATPIAEYRFDEIQYNDVANEIVDTIGTFHGQAKNAQPVAGKICNAIDLSASGITDYAILDKNVLNNKNDFTISIWAKTSKTGVQSILSGAQEVDNEFIMFFVNHEDFRPYVSRKSRNITTSSIADNSWQHLVWTHETPQSCIYINKILQGCATIKSKPLNIKSLILGQEQDSIGGGFVSRQAVEGLLDELLIFDRAISSSDVTKIYDNQNIGLGYDGATRASCTVEPVANFQFDETSWSGNGSEVIDETGNFNAQSINGANTENSTPAISGSPGTCGYGTFDGSNDYLALPSSFENHQGSFTITAWINPANLQSGSRIFADDENNSRGYAFSLSDPGSGKLRFYSRGVSPVSVDTASSVISSDTWTFVTAVHNSVNKTREIYVNGVAQTVTGGATSNTYTGTWGVDTGVASIGGETDSGETNNRFTGKIDEVRFYGSALSASQISTVYNETHACAISTPHHFEIVHDGNGLTCEAESIAIKACTNADCSTLHTTAVDVQLSVNGTANKTITVLNGSTTTDFSHTVADTATLSLDETYECKNGASTSCDVVFADAGFRFLYGTAESSTIENQISGDDFINVVKLQAVETVNGVCTGLFTGNVDIELSQQNIDPNSTSGLSFNVNGSSVAKYPVFTSNIRLNFDGYSKAIIPTPVYLDAGQIRLHAKYDVGGVNLSGNSNDFWVSPKKLVVTATSGGRSIDGNTATSTTIHKAGKTFDFTVTAFNSLGTAAANITANYIPNNIEFLLTRTGPTGGGVDSSFNYGNGSLTSHLTPTYQDVTLTAFNSGISSTNSASYSEVGLLNLDLQDTNYGFVGNTIAGDAINIGRFTPDYFDVVITSNSFEDTCVAAGVTDFTYIGQPFSYLNTPELLITAKNTLGATTQNYTEANYQKLIDSGIDITFPEKDTTQKGTDNTTEMVVSPLVTNGTLTTPLSTPASSLGVMKYTFNDSDTFTYDKDANSKTAPFTMAYDIVVDAIQDSDDVNANASLVANIPTSNTVSPTGVNFRFGRWFVENTFGPETSDLPVPMAIQYYDGSSFVTNPLDSCTVFDAINLTIDDINLNPGTTSASGSGSFISGTTRRVILSAPGTPHQGAVPVSYTIPSMPWLLYDWNGDGNFDQNPTAVATFGLFRGNDRIIYQREVNN